MVVATGSLPFALRGSRYQDSQGKKCCPKRVEADVSCSNDENDNPEAYGNQRDTPGNCKLSCSELSSSVTTW
jgi:hypothetical protein